MPGLSCYPRDAVLVRYMLWPFVFFRPSVTSRSSIEAAERNNLQIFRIEAMYLWLIALEANSDIFKNDG